ncbi:RHS repeat-associated core domain protein-containing protein [Pseudomonas sp. GM78]|uniref:RHS repeat-associated core domain-containing protein n=1 Tax=Pseudomonas sp. GM78 TaxID=1144337 RepID=UPI000270B286|nr:RHS repeat-associated core domain-containing protein [Pseudomonas sp. GM78]EJN18585.1 RHS repeat-associated core domain protein-containing protein [Pseudomonas sp. GM78]
MQSPHESLLCQYRYDALDRLIGHTPANEAQHQRFYCKSRLATEIQGALRDSIVQHGDLLLAQQQRSGNELGTTLLATDQQRSVLHIVKSEQFQQPIAYSPYGHSFAVNGLLSLLGFNGKRHDSMTEHYLLGNGYRAFNPVLMRFNNPDNLSPFGRGGLNPYAYCSGDPVNEIDPTGHASIKILKTITRAIEDWQVNRLIRKNEKIKKLMTRQQIENFKQLYTNTLSLYQSEPFYIKTKKPPKLFNLANEALPPRVRDIVQEQHLMPTPKPVYRPQHIVLKTDLEHLDNIATRDSNGAISGFDARLIDPKFNRDIHSNLIYLRNKMRKNNEKISKIRNG